MTGDKSRIVSNRQQVLADGLRSGRVRRFAEYDHGINLSQPQRCAREIEGTRQ
jgi:hypothetical protein